MLISSSNLSAATLNLASLFFFVLLAFSFILLFCCALPLWTVCPLSISFKKVNELFALSCKLSISFLIPATFSSCSWALETSPAHPFPAWGSWNHTILCYFNESHLLHELPLESSGQLIDMLLDQWKLSLACTACLFVAFTWRKRPRHDGLSEPRYSILSFSFSSLFFLSQRSFLSTNTYFSK